MPASSAEIDVTVLNVDPGGNSSAYDRGSIGFAGSFVSAVYASLTAVVLCPASGLGSYVGLEYIANTAPVFTSRTTTDPLRPSRWSAASYWRSRRSESTTFW